MRNHVTSSYSPQSRIEKISARLSYFPDNLECEDGTKLDTLAQRCTVLDSLLWEAQDEISKKTTALQEQLLKLQAEFIEENNAGESYFAGKTQELHELEFSLKEILVQNLASRKTAELKYRRIFDERVNSLYHEVLRESTHRKEATDTISDYISEKATHIQSMLRKEAAGRQKLLSDIEKRMTEETALTAEGLAQERKAREDTEEELLRTLQEALGRLKGEVEAERNDRESCEDTLLGLLEETCSKLNELST